MADVIYGLIVKIKDLFSIQESVRRLITVSMAQWKVDRWNGTNNLKLAAIQHGYFEGTPYSHCCSSPASYDYSVQLLTATTPSEQSTPGLWL